MAAPPAGLVSQWTAIEDRLSRLEAAMHDRSGQNSSSAGAASQRTALGFDPGLSAQILGTREDADAGPLQGRLWQELTERGITQFSLVRVPPNYYEEDLEFRRRCVGAASVDHLCKSLVMVNTRAPEGPPDAAASREEASVPKYVAVVVQYTAAVNGDKLNSCVRAMANAALPPGAPPLSRKLFNMRLCPADVSQQLTGFEHNAVTPVGTQTLLPIIMSNRIPQLQPDWFWLGAGQTDLKLGVSAASFVRAYKSTVADIC